MRGSHPITSDGREGDNVIDVDTVCCYTILEMKDLDANLAGTNLESSQELGEFYFSLDTLTHLLYLYALGVPAYRIRFYVPLSLATIERSFRIFRQSIYDESLQKLKELKKLSGEIVDEALFGGQRE